MKVSVIIIAYNIQEYIEESIQSVLNQSRKADEIILIDDCSTDATPTKIEKFNDKLQYYRLSQNSGALLAALSGVELATGDVICMLDGDDTWAKNKLAIVEEEFLCQPDLILLSHNHIRTDADGKNLNIKDETHTNIEKLILHNSTKEALSNDLKDTILNQRGYWLGSAYAFRQKAFNIIKFKTQLKSFSNGDVKNTYLDLVIAPYLVLTNPKGNVGYTNKTYFNYRIHGGGSLSDNYTVDKALNSLNKGKTVNELILHILIVNNAQEKYIARRKLLLKEYFFIENLYKKNYSIAVRTFIYLSKNLWVGQKRRKEFIRMMSVLFLSPSFFLRVKQKREFN